MKNILKKPKVLVSVIGLVAVIVVIIVFIITASKPQAEFVTVGRQNITQSISASGVVKAATSIGLAFVGGGRIVIDG